MTLKEKLREIYILLKKSEIRVNIHHAKTILILLCIASFSFVLVQNYRGEFLTWKFDGDSKSDKVDTFPQMTLWTTKVQFPNFFIYGPI